MEVRIFSQLIFFILLNILAGSSAFVRDYGACHLKNQEFGKCRPGNFQCLSGGCISRSKFCDGIKHCSDNSDELHCGKNYPTTRSYYYYRTTPGYGGTEDDSSPCPKNFMKCRDSYSYDRYYKCIPQYWMCDGDIDCPDEDDEENCPVSFLKPDLAIFVRQKAIEWLLNKTEPASPTRKWGPLVHKSAVALYLSDYEFLSSDSHIRKEISDELSIQLLSKINQKKLQGIPSSELASFVNALLVTCTDPRNFHGFNLVEELRSRVDKQNNTNPYVLLSLCNAGDTITGTDVEKLEEVFRMNNRELWADTQAITLMALSCAKGQMGTTISEHDVHELAWLLKRLQRRNGTVENLQTTLLVMQALYATESHVDPNTFDEEKAITYILQNQKSDGSFGNFMLTYYALPVLNCMSMVNISSNHCEKVIKDEDSAVYDLVNQSGPKTRVRYSVWFGMHRDVERTLSLRVPVNISFYGVMEIAAEIDAKYRFEYTMKDRKLYITAVSGVHDDPENEMFWFPYVIKDKKPVFTEKSTADFITKHDDHLIMWFRAGDWSE